MYPEKIAKFAWGLVFIGFNVTFLPQFVLGYLGMPRRYYNYAPRFQPLHQLSTVGSWIVSAGLFLTFGYLFWAIKYGKKAGANPWNAKSLEWTIASPPPTENFISDPVITEPYPYGTPAHGSTHV
jgi:cytochrome c oxidase subunit I